MTLCTTCQIDTAYGKCLNCCRDICLNCGDKDSFFIHASNFCKKSGPGTPKMTTYTPEVKTYTLEMTKTELGLRHSPSGVPELPFRPGRPGP